MREMKKKEDNLKSKYRYLHAGVHFTTAGIVRPEWIEWEGEKYEVERIYEVCHDTTPFGARLLSYDCRVAGKRMKLYYDGISRFFTEEERAHVS